MAATLRWGSWALVVMAGVAVPAWAADKPARARPAAAAVASPPAAGETGPAMAAGQRSVDAADVARVERRIEARPSTTIWQARLPDGTLELTDRPPTASGASAVQSRTYPLPADGQARQRADAERAYWRRQAEAFEARRRERDREQVPEAPRTVIIQAEIHRHVVQQDDRWPWPVYRPAPVGAIVLPGVPAVYRSSPGAVQGRDPGFLGSGFTSGR